MISKKVSICGNNGGKYSRNAQESFCFSKPLDRKSKHQVHHKQERERHTRHKAASRGRGHQGTALCALSEAGSATMSEEKPGAKKFDQVAMNSIWREHCMKERSLLTLNENFRLNPHALAVSSCAYVDPTESQRPETPRT